MPGIEYTYELARQLVPEITLEDVNKLVAAWTSEKSNVLVVKAPAKEGLVVPSKESARGHQGCPGRTITPYEDKVSEEPLVASRPRRPGDQREDDGRPGAHRVDVGQRRSGWCSSRPTSRTTRSSSGVSVPGERPWQRTTSTYPRGLPRPWWARAASAASTSSS